MSRQYYCKINHQLYGPFSGQNLQELALQGRLSPTDEVRLDGTNRWIRAGDVKNLQFQNNPREEAELAELDESNETSQPNQPVQPPINHSANSSISMPPPREYKAVETVAYIYLVLGWLTIVGCVFLSIMFVKTEMAGGVVMVIIVGAVAVLTQFATAQFLMMAVNSARNLDRLTSSNLIIMQAILQSKK